MKETVDKSYLTIIEENEDFIVIEKPSGMIVHPWKECADKISVMYVLKEQTGKWIYPIHRLDRAVSGVMIFAFSSEMAKRIQDQWSLNSTHKIYYGLNKGIIPEAKFIDYPLWNQGRTIKQDARTNFWPIEKNDFVTLTKFQLETGRYHQIRRHCSAMGHQLIGDTKYGKGQFNRFYRENFSLHRLFLHCAGLKINLNNQAYEFFADFPQDLKNVILNLGFSVPNQNEIFEVTDLPQIAFSKKQDLV